MDAMPRSLQVLLDRFDSTAFDMPAGRARVRLTVGADARWDLEARPGRDRVREARDETEPDAELRADPRTWERVATDLPSGMAAFRSGRLQLRRNLHLGVGFLAAASGDESPGRLRFDTIQTRLGRVSTMQAGQGEPILMLHGLGATKAEFMPTLAALAPAGFRVVAIDLPGFGDSDKPLAAPYDAPFFARWVLATMDALGIGRAHVLGHSMGGRVALEVGMRHPERVEGLVLMTPSMAWLAERRWAGWLKLVRPELGLIQPAPKAVVESVVKRVVPGSQSQFVRPALDEFLRAYLTPRGRAAFYASARQIVLDDPGDFWAALEALSPRSLFIWGRQDTLVPIGFMRHVERVLPDAHHVELDCGHVPQLEQPARLHEAVARFLSGDLRPGHRGERSPVRAAS